MSKLKAKNICLITSGQVGSNPRLVKEADALSEAGANVTVIALNINNDVHVQDRDHAVLQSARWQYIGIDRGYAPIYGLRSIMHRIARYRLFRPLKSISLDVIALNRMAGKLANVACQKPADLYIAHNLAALPAAYKAARAHKAKLGFDAEDFHSGELPNIPANRSTMMIVSEIESYYLPRCDYLTAASPGIAKAYASTYGLKEPLVVLNVFPQSQAPAGLTAFGKKMNSPSLYWFSQTLGPGRGLECVVEAIGRSVSKPKLFLRGNPSTSYVEALMSFAKKNGVDDKIVFLPTASPSEMAILAAEYDLGVSSEPGTSKNNDLALSNKIFTFILAGIPVLASSTDAQVDIARKLPGAIFLYPHNDAISLAGMMDNLLLSPELLASARASAWGLAHTQYNWDIEKLKFLEKVTDSLL